MSIKNLKSFIVACIAAASMASAPAIAGTVNLITNGSFEDPIVQGSWRVFQGDAVEGWSVESGAGVEIQTNSVRSVLDTPFGNQYVELDSDTRNGGTDNPTNSSIVQSLTDLTAGLYKFSFYYSPRTKTLGDNGISFLLTDGTPSTVFEGTVEGPSDAYPRGEWTRVERIFYLDTPANPYHLVFSATGNENTLGGLIDNVSLTLHPVPVPASGLLLLGGLGGIAVLRRRKKR